jgi:hypothetical protein
MSFCRHHPATTSRWHCSQCQLSFCDRCVYTSGNQARPGCLHCATPLDFETAQTDVVPFWARLHDFFTYPFQTGPIALLGLAILASILLSPGLLAALAGVFIMLLQIKYGFNVIATISEGEFQAPSLPATITETGYSVVFKQFAILLVMFVTTATVSVKLTPALGIPLGIFFFLVLPMSTIVLATERSLRAALNPVILVTFIYRIGWPYLLVYLYLIMMFSCSLTLGQLAYEYAGAEAAQVITSVSGYYFTLVMYSLMGYMVYQYRHRLQIGSSIDDYSVATDSSGEDPRIHVLLQQGEYERAMDALVNNWKSHDYPPTLIEKYLKVVRHCSAWDHLQRYLVPLLVALFKSNSTKVMPRLLRDILAVRSDFEITDTMLALKVAGAVREHNDSKLAARLLWNQHRLTKDASLQRESIDLLTEILEKDLQKPDIAAKYRALRETMLNPSASNSGGLSLAD